MTNKKDLSLQSTIAFAVFTLSGFMIFSPLHKSENIPVSLLCACIAATTLTIPTIKIFSKKQHSKKNHPTLLIIFSSLAALFSLFYTLILLTEVIKDTAYIANRGVSLMYYVFSALAVLAVSLYLCLGKSKGINRFCILCSAVFTIFFIVSLFSLTTTKSICPYFYNQKNPPLLSPALSGIKAGIFYSADSAVFLFGCQSELFSQNAKQCKKKLQSGFFISLALIVLYNLLTYLIFGSLTCQISDPDYSLIKLIRGADLTELVSFVRIISFLIKSSFCLYLSAKALSVSLTKIKLSQKNYTLLLYTLIPATFLFFAIYDKTLEYGAFQHLIYPVNAVMSLFFLIFYCLSEK